MQSPGSDAVPSSVPAFRDIKSGFGNSVARFSVPTASLHVTPGPGAYTHPVSALGGRHKALQANHKGYGPLVSASPRFERASARQRTPAPTQYQPRSQLDAFERDVTTKAGHAGVFESKLPKASSADGQGSGGRRQTSPVPGPGAYDSTATRTGDKLSFVDGRGCRQGARWVWLQADRRTDVYNRQLADGPAPGDYGYGRPVTWHGARCARISPPRSRPPPLQDRQHVMQIIFGSAGSGSGGGGATAATASVGPGSYDWSRLYSVEASRAATARAAAGRYYSQSSSSPAAVAAAAALGLPRYGIGRPLLWRDLKAAWAGVSEKGGGSAQG